MNLPRLRELAQKGQNGTLRPEEAKALFEALPEVFDIASGFHARIRALIRRDKLRADKAWEHRQQVRRFISLSGEWSGACGYRDTTISFARLPQ